MKASVGLFKKTLPWLLLPCAALGIFYFGWRWNPLPSDEEMIANFKAHRADFVEVVKRYQNYPQPPDKDTSTWYMEGDTLEVFRRAGIDHIDYRTPVWLPNPYSMESEKRASSEIKADKTLTLFHKYGELKIALARTPRIDHPKLSDSYLAMTPLHALVWKDYYYFPEVPRIEHGVLLGPVNHLGKYWYRLRVLPSLNRLPLPWKDYECVVRQIEPQWFLRMCNGH